MTPKHWLYLGLCLSAGVLALPACALADQTHTDPHWTYEEEKKWALLLDPTYSPRFPFAECGIGQKQSPINIEEADVISTEDIDDLEPRYLESPLNVSNNGHTIRINFSQGAVRINKVVYDLAQFHFHAPSEHRLNGASFPALQDFMWCIMFFKSTAYTSVSHATQL
jgi:carbonic anhydrase